MAQTTMDIHRRLLIGISAALAARDEQSLRRALQEGASGADAMRVEEVILQSYLFLGYPIALNAFALWREISGRGPGDAVDDDWEGWSHRGGNVCRTVYGGQYEGLRRNVRILHPDMERWMVVEGYGKVLGRPHLDLAMRELCIISLLAVFGAPRQLHSHLRGALNAGACQSEVEEALKVACDYLDDQGSVETWAIWEQVRTRVSGADADGPSKSP